MKARAALTLGLLVPMGLWSSACSRARPPVARHLVLVTIDTLRADRLGCYGNSEVATPNLDRLAREGAMAPEASAHVPLTRPSHVALLTGLLPAESGIRDNVSPSLSPDIPTLAEVLSQSGFHTAGFVSSIVLASQSGLGRGFSRFSDAFEAGADDARFLNTLQKRGDLATDEASAWLRAQGEGRLFAWVHLYDPHDPYEPPEPYASRYAGRPYDGEVAWSDELVGRLLSVLQERRLLDDTLVVVTSDHGEGLGEHGEGVHGFFAYQTTLRVPLLFRGPGVRPGTRLGVTARTVDLMPTLLEILGIPRDPKLKLAGRSLAGALRGAETPVEEATYAESLLPLLHFGWSDLRVLREGRWKYIQAPRPELYDLREDPGELRNRADREPGRLEALRKALEARLANERASSGTGPGAAGVPPELLEKLGALGYLGAGTPAPGAATGADPKDKIEDYKVVNGLVREGLLKLRAKDYAGSAAAFHTLLARDIESFEVHYYLGRALVGLGRHADAATQFEAATLRLPGFGAAHLALGESLLATGRLDAAVAALRKGQSATPKDPRLFEREAQVWRRLRRLDNAAKAYEQAVGLAPKDALLRVQLGETYRDLGESEKAVSALREAVELEPGSASYWNSLGMVLGARGEMDEAGRAFDKALEHDATNAQYAYNRGLAYLRQGRAGEAGSLFRRTLALDPRFVAARKRLAEIGRP